ncbi:hypothetical protein K450DRAFT_238737 [Umbelopsis ramanniana AG]|uniref:AB hydrolase-1 domain-containing protein n=1 Tax=Umbelopsis ramanniana AG TaxID=1314678 RepID=A0AAD5EBE6_UMBRA|nr:uncharacterized protein K450DRAFT_238737 [Umbelopsis ramanniana AG]KAI8580227.1 hypothetical protein K450DRAFT_238737 [Umbelopsis ramanniana AG]
MQVLRILQRHFRRQTKTVSTAWSICSTLTPWPSSRSNFLYGKDWDFYVALICIVIPIYSVTFASWAHVIYSIALDESHTFSAPRRLLLGWSILECLFSLYHLSVQRTYQSLISYPKVPLERMRSLYSDCLEQLTDFEEQLPLWFFDAPFSTILRGNMKEWLCWAMFYRHVDAITDGSEEDIFLEEMLAMLQNRANYTFEPGHNPAVKCCRLNLDPVQSVHRPLIFYATVHLLDTSMSLLLKHYGFQRYPCGALSYWLLPCNADTTDNRPILFIHGIGMGLCSYVSFLNSLYQKSRKTNRPIILIELPHISMSLFCQRPFHTTPFTMSSTLAVVDEIFDRHQLKKSATVVGHSLGTIVAGWIIKERPNIVDRTVLIDPVCFQLYEAYLCQNFVYKMPTTGFELVLWYFVAKEACIAWYLGRWFWWHQNIMFPKDFPSLDQTQVFLAEKDRIIHAPRVYQYLKRNDVPAVLFEGYGHADALLIHTKEQDRMVQAILKND